MSREQVNDFRDAGLATLVVALLVSLVGCFVSSDMLLFLGWGGMIGVVGMNVFREGV